MRLSRREQIEDLIVEQIRIFKQPAKMCEADLFEFHLRHYEINVLYREIAQSRSAIPETEP